MWSLGLAMAAMASVGLLLLLGCAQPFSLTVGGRRFVRSGRGVFVDEAGCVVSENHLRDDLEERFQEIMYQRRTETLMVWPR